MVDPLETAVEEVLSRLEYELVELRRVGSPQRPLLQVRIDHRGADRPDVAIPGQPVTADDCARASRAIEQELDGRGLVGAEYTLEVSSPGSDRPLKKAADWRRFTGSRVKVRHQAVAGTVIGFIEGVDEISAQRILIRVRREDGEETMELDLAQLREAWLAPDTRPKPRPGKKK